MEVLDWLRARRRRLVLLAIVPALAMVGALVVSLGVDERHRSTTSIEVLSPDADTPNAALQAAVRLGRLGSGPVVVEETAAATGVPPDRIDRGLAVEQDGTSVEVTYQTGRGAEEADAVALAAAESGLRELYRPSLEQAEVALGDADQRDLAAREAVSGFEAANGLAEDTEGYRRRLDPGRVVEYERLLAEVARTSSSLERAERDVSTLETRLATATAQLPASTGPAAAISPLSVVARRVLLAGAVGLVLAALLAVVLELATGSPPVVAREPRRDPDEVIESLRVLADVRPDPPAGGAPTHRRAVGES